MYNYCTLFDSNYLTRGLTMYESLKNSSNYFHLYIFAFDDKCLEILTQLSLSNVTIVSLNEFENKELLELKKNRTKSEYCWTCTPTIIQYSIKKFNLMSCTYIDADLYFFSDPSVLIDELKDKSVLITEHRYTTKYDQSDTSGIYCVQFMTFRNDENGMRVLNWWEKACNEWCYARFEDGKFGDQKYLDDWTERFEGIHVLQNIGGGVAPWNMQQYTFSKSNEYIVALEKETNKNFDVVFFHFHALKLIDKKLYGLSHYELFNDCRNIIYKEYVIHLETQICNIRKKFNFEVYEEKLYKNYNLMYINDINAYLHS